MPDNLSISISADTTKAQADLELLKGKLALVNTEVRKLRNEGAKAGDILPSANLVDATRRAAELTKQIDAAGGAARRTNSAFDVLASRGGKRLLTQFDDLSKTAQNMSLVIGRLSGSFAAGIVGASVIKGLSLVSSLIADVNAKLLELRDTAQQTGQRPAAIEAARRIAGRLGLDASDADKMMTKTAEAFAKFKSEAGKPISTTGVKDLTQRTQEAADAANQATSEFSKGTATLRGNSQLTFDAAKAYEMIGVQQKNYKDNLLGQKQFQRDTNVAFLDFVEKTKLGTSALNALSQELFGLPFAKAAAQAKAQIAGLEDEIKKLGDVQARIDLAEKAKASRAEAGQIFEDMFNSVNDTFNRIDIAVNTWVQNFLTKTLPDWAGGIAKAFEGFWPKLLQDMEDGWNVMWANMTTNMPWLANLRQTLSDTFNWIIQSAAKAAEAIRSITGGAPAGDISIPAMPAGATGGMVTGPGSGTSDSILARLSNGEFVMRAAAVQRWGPRFMAALNGLQNPFGYAGGGLVPRFASGGMVTARTADGAVVNLHFPGGSFALRGDKAVVGSLTREARRAGMLSAGRLAGALN